MSPLAASSLAAKELAGPIVCHDRSAACRVRSHRLSGRPHRRVVCRVRVHPGGGGHRVSSHCVDPVAHDVLEVAETASRGREPTGRLGWCVSSTNASTDCCSGISTNWKAASATRPVTAVLVVLVLGSIYYMYTSAKSELAPQEDQSFVVVQATSAPECDPAGEDPCTTSQALPDRTRPPPIPNMCFRSTRRARPSWGSSCRHSVRNSANSVRELDPAGRSGNNICRGSQDRRAPCFNRPPCPARSACRFSLPSRPRNPPRASTRYRRIFSPRRSKAACLFSSTRI